MTVTDAGYHYHYEVLDFAPRTDISMGGWGFSIRLDYEYARKLYRKPLDPGYHARLQTIGRDAVRAVMGEKPLFDRQPFSFWDDTCLLTNVTVIGDACGLDMDHSHFSDVKREEIALRTYRRVEYHPHNVDSVYQAAGGMDYLVRHDRHLAGTMIPLSPMESIA